jgi:deoxyadenosine/deoxycytidine kinase
MSLDFPNNSCKKTPTIISIEGNIGSGKSTIISVLKEKFFPDKELKVCFLQEPVDKWNTICDKNGISIIEKFYKDQEKYAFHFQMMAYISRIALLNETIKKNYDVIITERSIFTDKNVFAQMLFDKKKISDIEFKIYNEWFYNFIDNISNIYTIYLKTDPNIAYQRVLKRNRNGESIDLNYLIECSEYHDSWIKKLNNNSCLILNGNYDIDDNTVNYNNICEQISDYTIKIITNECKL